VIAAETGEMEEETGAEGKTEEEAAEVEVAEDHAAAVRDEVLACAMTDATGDGMTGTV